MTRRSSFQERGTFDAPPQEWKPYHYRGEPGWRPEDVDFHGSPESGNTVGNARRLARMAEFARLRQDEGLSAADAATAVDVSIHTARNYESQRRIGAES